MAVATDSRTVSAEQRDFIDVQDSLSRLRREVDGIALMARGAVANGSDNDDMEPIVTAAERVSDRLVEIVDMVAALRGSKA